MKQFRAAALASLLILALLLSLTTGVSAQRSTATSTATVTFSPTAKTAVPPTVTPSSPAASPTTPVTPTAQLTPTALASPTAVPESARETPTQGADTRVSSDEVPLELTVYNQNIAFIKEQRVLTVTAGTNTVQISDVPAQIDPSSVHFSSLTNPNETHILEQTYAYDLVDTAKLLSRYISQPITVRTANGGEYSGTLLAGEPDIILDTFNGLKVIKQDQIQEYTFPHLPSGLISRPTLNWIVDAQKSGIEQIRLTYLTGGLSWKASYVILLAPNSEALDLNAWVTLQNDSGVSYPNARLKLIAGDINLVQQLTEMPARAAVAYAEKAAENVQERSFFEYHLYKVHRPVTIRQGEIKQIEFITAPAVTCSKAYVYEATPRFTGYGHIADGSDYSYPDAQVQVRLAVTNSVTNGLGIPLPEGLARVYQQDADGGAEFIGEDTIAHTPQNETASLFLGNAFDLTAERKQVQYRQLADRSAQESWEITLRNHKKESVTIQVIENLFRSQDAEISASSQDYEMLSANRVRFLVSIPPDGEQVITYTVVYRW